MKRTQIAPGVFYTQVPGEKFKRCKLAVHLVVPGRRENATALALLPHVLDRRCDAVPDPTALSRLLFSLYGAELGSESYTAGASRIVSLSVGGLKSEYAMAGEDLAGQYLDLLCNLLFHPKLSDQGFFEDEDLAIEKEKQAEFLKSELNDKRSYCMRQARRKLYADSPLGIESPGYLEDLPGITPENLYAEYTNLLNTAQVEVLACGMDAEAAARRVAESLVRPGRAPVALPPTEAVPVPPSFEHFSEGMDTVQGKLCILCASGKSSDGTADAVGRVASALYGGLPTSRLFVSVREQQGLCYYCATAFGYFGGTLTIDSGVDHDKAEHARDAILAELEKLQQTPVPQDELDTAIRYLKSAFSSAKDSPDALMNWAFTEQIKGTGRSLDEMAEAVGKVTPGEVQALMAGLTPAVEYVITGKGGASDA
ncbi:insulinase family protein [Ruminococcaceae bacterium OttesenSCG-928-D13]|nr:insulinase family protein [Ruminococcaceae bacterium OttesenSCG-928-D13]